jgi:hypothetical protein
LHKIEVERITLAFEIRAIIGLKDGGIHVNVSMLNYLGEQQLEENLD